MSSFISADSAKAAAEAAIKKAREALAWKKSQGFGDGGSGKNED